MRAETRKRSVASLDLSWDWACRFCCVVSSYDNRSTVRFDFGIKGKFYQVGKFTNTDSMNNEDQMPYGVSAVCSALGTARMGQKRLHH